MVSLPYLVPFYQFLFKKASPNLQTDRKSTAPCVCKMHKGLCFTVVYGDVSYLPSIFTATSRAIFIMLVKVVWRSSAESSVPLTRLSEIEQMAKARFPV